MNLVVRKLLSGIFFSIFSVGGSKNYKIPSIRACAGLGRGPEMPDRENPGFLDCIFRTACFVVARIHRVGRQLEYCFWSPETINLALRNLLIGTCFDFGARGGGPKPMMQALSHVRWVGRVVGSEFRNSRNVEMRFF